VTEKVDRASSPRYRHQAARGPRRQSQKMYRCPISSSHHHLYSKRTSRQDTPGRPSKVTRCPCLSWSTILESSIWLVKRLTNQRLGPPEPDNRRRCRRQRKMGMRTQSSLSGILKAVMGKRKRNDNLETNGFILTKVSSRPQNSLQSLRTGGISGEWHAEADKLYTVDRRP